ncbi:hypothetical protein [Piscirickettsia litoralis]|nr:hypothetical protein [Piscirickettsia litoralis]
MLIIYQGEVIDFSKSIRVSVKQDLLTFHGTNEDKFLRLGSEHIKAAETVVDYIYHSYQEGYKSLNLSSYLSSARFTEQKPSESMTYTYGIVKNL